MTEAMDFPGVSDGKVSAYNAGHPGLIPGLGRASGEGNGNPLQYSGLENSMDCRVHGVSKNWTRLSDFHFQKPVKLGSLMPGDIKRHNFNPWIRKIPWRRNGNPFQYSCLENPHGQKSLVSYSPYGRKELDMTEAT